MNKFLVLILLTNTIWSKTHYHFHFGLKNKKTSHLSLKQKTNSHFGSCWEKIPGSALNVSAFTKRESYLTNKNTNIYQKKFQTGWNTLPGKGHDVGVGADRSVWVIGTNREAGGFGIYRFNRCKNNWDKVNGSAVRIDVGPEGKAWVVNKNDNIYEYTGSGWSMKRGKAKDVGVGPEGAVWIIGTNVEAGGFGIYKYNGNNGWSKVNGSAVRIAVGPNGVPWVVNKNGNIYQKTASGWSMKTGRAKDIGVGVDGSVWVIGTNVEAGGYGIYRHKC